MGVSVSIGAEVSEGGWGVSVSAGCVVEVTSVAGCAHPEKISSSTKYMRAFMMGLKSMGFMREKNSFVYTDSKYFDFIPFSFSKSREAFFINNNFTVDQLINSNKNYLIEKDRENTIRSDLFFRTKE